MPTVSTMNNVQKNSRRNQMDVFQLSAQEMRMRSTLVIGATFGIFLTIGDAWSKFLESVVIAIVPNHDNNVLRELLYATFASAVCLLLLFLLVKVDKGMTAAGRHINRANMKRVAQSIPGLHVIDQTPVAEPRLLMGNTKHSQARRSRAKSRTIVRQGFN